MATKWVAGGLTFMAQAGWWFSGGRLMRAIGFQGKLSQPAAPTMLKRYVVQGAQPELGMQPQLPTPPPRLPEASQSFPKLPCAPEAQCGRGCWCVTGCLPGGQEPRTSESPHGPGRSQQYLGTKGMGKGEAQWQRGRVPLLWRCARNCVAQHPVIPLRSCGPAAGAAQPVTRYFSTAVVDK